ncbi:MAG: alpha/beta hydrolase, partial [Betaproteobacteria bacterium]
MTKSFIALSSALVALTLVAACSPLGLLNATTPTDDHRAINGVAYGDNPRQKLDLYIPESHRPALPVVVFFYGGS